MAKEITFNEDTIGHREPRKGELNYELKRIITKFCTTKPFNEAVKSIEIAASRFIRKFGVTEFECEYDRGYGGILKHDRPWINESVQVRAFRKRSNGTFAIHRVGATSFPHFFGPDERKMFANLSAPRDIHIFDVIDDPYDWNEKSCLEPRPSLKAKFKKIRKANKAKAKAKRRG